MKHTLKSVGIDESQVKIALRDLNVQMYIGASLSVSDQTISLWQKNFDEMKADGTYQRIVKSCSSR
jgi:ABC-type amino acid transport substrate-binding protein